MNPAKDAMNAEWESGASDEANVEIEVPLTPLFSLEDVRVGKWIETAPPPRRWVIEDSLPLRKTGIVVAPGGTGKSQWAIQLILSVATGTALANCWDIGESGTVLALFAEEEAEELHRRLYSTVQAMNPDSEKLESIKKRVLIKSVVGENNFMTGKNKDGELGETDYLERLLLAIEEIKNIKLIIIDPISRFRGGNEIDNDDATRFVVVLEKLSKLTGATVIGLHHASKASMNESNSNQSASRGASALVDGVRWVMNMQTMTEAEAKIYNIPKDSRGYYVKFTVTKNNYAAPQSGEIWLFRGENGVLSKAILHGGKEEFQHKLKKKILDAVSLSAAKGEEYTRRAFSKKYAGVRNEFGVGDHKLRDIIEELLEDKKLCLQPPKKLGRNQGNILALPSSLEEKAEKYRRESNGE
ncbi:MAG: AAA family ATPase [Rickettsiales bacterium]|nr:AAA family ATPase [Rickettsiales bacterium]